jgi:hypothetical protein
VSFHDSAKMRLKDAATGQTVLEQFSGDDLHRKSGKWMTKQRIIDWTNDRYKELVADPETGQTIHSCDEPLSKHHGHGSAKKR